MKAPQAPSPRKTRQRGLLIALAARLILALIGSGLGAYFAFFSKSTAPVAPTIVGHAYFASSGLLSPDSKQAITDHLQINLENIPPPHPGKSYYPCRLNAITLKFKPYFSAQ